MKNIYKYFVCNNNYYIRIDKRTHNYQFLNQENEWVDDNDLKEYLNNSNNCVEITDDNVINTFNSFYNKIIDIPDVSQEEFDKMNDIDKLKYIALECRRDNHIIDNNNIKNSIHKS